MEYKKTKQRLTNLCLAAMFIALGLVLPFLTGQIPQVGSMLLPMHLPVLLCGLICGWQYGIVVGAVLPPLRYLLFGMPPIFPTGIAMAFELATYGLLAGLLYNQSNWKCLRALYRSLLLAMVGGRVVWGIVRVLCSGVVGEPFTWKLFISGALLTAIPGIMLQLIFIPILMVALSRAKFVPFHLENRPKQARNGLM